MGCPFSWKGYVGMWFATLVGCRIDIIKAQATEKRGNDMLHTLEKGEYPKGHRYWSNATGDLNAALEDLPVQLRRVLDELWSDGYGVECYLVEWNGRYCVQLSAMYDESYAADLGMGYPELVELARGRAEELGAGSRRMWTSGRLTTPSPRFGWSCRGTWMQTPSMRCRIG